MCSTDAPSAEAPSPKSQRYDAASPEAVKTTWSGAAPARVDVETATAGGLAAAAGVLNVRLAAATTATRTDSV
jgi:hypothetical protein